jgi:hypothetical protein
MPTSHEEVLVLLNAAIFFYIASKITYYFKINDDMGLMSTLLVGVFKGVIPFLVIFFAFVIYFAVFSAILGGNQNLAESYEGMPLAVGYFL